jgi:capsid protein
MSEKKKGVYHLSAVEKAISLVSPKAAQRRFQSRIELTEFSERAGTGRLRGDSGGVQKNGSPETYQSARNRLELMWEARDLERKSPLIAGVLKRLAQYVVGKLTYKSSTGDPEIDKIYNEYFEKWAKSSDYTGRMSFREQVEMLFRSTIRDGDHGFKIVESEDFRTITLQCIEADRIGSPYETRLDDGYISGLHLREGKVFAYDVYKRTTTSQYVKDAEVPANLFIHFFKNRRADEYRGRTPLEPALPSARDLLEIFGFEKAAQKFASMWAAFVTTNDPNGIGGMAWDKKDPVTGWNITEAVPGKILKTNPGEGIEFAQGVTRPNQAFLNLVELTIQMIALSLDLPFGFVFDMSKFGGVTARIETQLAKRTIQGFQRSLIDDVLDKVRDEVIGRAIMFRLLPSHPKWKSGQWHFGAHITSDIQYQTSADLQLIEAGLKSEMEWCEENDVDFERTQNALADAAAKRIEIAKSRGLPTEIPFRSMANATEMVAAFQAKDNPPPDGGLIEDVGESGVKPLLQIVEQYHAGAIDRESAVMQLTEVYGFDPQKAELFLPMKPAMGQVLPPSELPGG